jgi:hypothetical protein
MVIFMWNEVFLTEQGYKKPVKCRLPYM